MSNVFSRTPTNPSTQKGGRPGLVLAVLVTVQMMIVLDNTVVNLALPAIKAGLDFTPSGLAWVSNSYILVFGGLLLLGGRLGDMLGRRRVFFSGVALFSLASLIGGAAPSADLLVASRALQGAGAAAAAPSALAILISTFTEGPARNRALGLFFAMSAAGGALGLLVGGGLVSALSWRWVLWINVPFGLAVAAMIPLVIAETPRTPHRMDVMGTLSSVIGVTALVYGLIQAGRDGWIDVVTISSIALALLMLAIFAMVERRVHEPLVPMRLFQRRAASAGYVTMLLVPAVMVGMYFFTAQYLQTVLGYNAFFTGLAFLPMSITLFAMSRVVSQLIVRFGPRRLMLAGGVAQVAAMLWLSQVGEHSEYLTSVAPAVFLFGLAGGLLYAPLSSVLLAGVRAEDSGAAGGVIQAVQQGGAAVGIAVLVSVFGTASGHQNVLSSRDFVEAVSAAYATGAGLALVGLLLIWAFVNSESAATLERPSDHD